jgi:hypothetical protein
MKYMMFVCDDTEPETDESLVPDIHVWVAENDAAGRRITGNVLAEPSAATTVRVRGGEVLLTDGPFAETKEVLLGFFIVDCATFDEAIDAARDLACAHSSQGSYEIRPLALFLPGKDS